MRNIHMRFGGVTALSGADFDVREGEVHAWCGENGAGKTTAARILAGALEPAAGSVEVLGSAIDPRPASAIRAGVRMITQEISLFPPLTVAENLVTGGAGHTGRLINWRSLRRRAEEYLRLIGLDVDPAAPLAGLTIGEQQLVEIARAMFSGGRVVILDEPTSALGTAEAARLFEFVRRMAASGTSFVLITHFLDDVIEHAHRTTVLRNGRVVGTLTMADSTKADLVRLMVGHDELLAEAVSGFRDGGGPARRAATAPGRRRESPHGPGRHPRSASWGGRGGLRRSSFWVHGTG
jgi:ribose transport system ATP-binding protein